MKIRRKWIVFFLDGKELLRYTLADEGEGERQATIGLLAYENDVPERAIYFAEVTA